MLRPTIAASAPISLTANLQGDGAASVSWAAPESNGGSLLSGYKIQWQSVDADEGAIPQTKHVYFDVVASRLTVSGVSPSVVSFGIAQIKLIPPTM